MQNWPERITHEEPVPKLNPDTRISSSRAIFRKAGSYFSKQTSDIVSFDISSLYVYFLISCQYLPFQIAFKALIWFISDLGPQISLHAENGLYNALTRGISHQSNICESGYRGDLWSKRPGKCRGFRRWETYLVKNGDSHLCCRHRRTKVRLLPWMESQVGLRFLELSLFLVQYRSLILQS